MRKFELCMKWIKNENNLLRTCRKANRGPSGVVTMESEADRVGDLAGFFDRGNGLEPRVEMELVRR